VQRQLVLAGVQRMTVSDFVGLRGLLTFVFAGLGVAVSLASGQSALPFILIVFAFGGIAYLVPGLMLRQATNRRRAEITSVMPDAIDLLTISVEAGLGFDQALLRVVRKSRNALTIEFGGCCTRCSLELPVEMPCTVCRREWGSRISAQSLQPSSRQSSLEPL
jgi:tight adherence protein C